MTKVVMNNVNLGGTDLRALGDQILGLRETLLGVTAYLAHRPITIAVAVFHYQNRLDEILTVPASSRRGKVLDSY